jgi:hypothetical protein
MGGAMALLLNVFAMFFRTNHSFGAKAAKKIAIELVVIMKTYNIYFKVGSSTTNAKMGPPTIHASKIGKIDN